MQRIFKIKFVVHLKMFDENSLKTVFFRLDVCKGKLLKYKVQQRLLLRTPIVSISEQTIKLLTLFIM